MGNLLRHLGKIAFATITALSLTALLITSCDLGTPGNNNNHSNAIARGKSVSVVDGVIELGEVTLDFCGNDVTSGATMTELLPTKAQEPNGLVSGMFEMELNTACNLPVTLSMPVNELLLPSGEETEYTQVLLGLGNKFKDDEGRISTIYSFIPVTITGNMATASFIPANHLQNLYGSSADGGRRTPDDVWFDLGIFTVETWFADGNFRIFFPNKNATMGSMRANCFAMLNDLEEAYSFFGPSGKGYSYSTRTKKPIEIYITDFGTADNANEGEYTTGMLLNSLYLNHYDGWINLTDRYFKSGYNSVNMKPLIYHEFFHFVQSLYIANYPEDRWFDDASSAYYEWFVKGSMPNNVPNRVNQLFKGLPAPDNSNASSYVRSILLKYLVDKQLGNDGFIKTLIQADPADWNVAFVSNTKPYVDYAMDFWKLFISGDYGPSVPREYYRDIVPSGTGSMAGLGIARELKLPAKSDLDKIRTGIGDMPPMTVGELSIGPYGAQLVKLYYFAETYNKLKDTDAIAISVDGNCDFRVFEIENVAGSPFRVFAPEDGELVIENFKSKALYDYLVLVTALHGSGNRDCDVYVDLVYEEEEGDKPSGLLGEWIWEEWPHDDGVYFVFTKTTLTMEYMVYSDWRVNNGSIEVKTTPSSPWIVLVTSYSLDGNYLTLYMYYRDPMEVTR